jgi:hypothetical protein
MTEGASLSSIHCSPFARLHGEGPQNSEFVGGRVVFRVSIFLNHFRLFKEK